MRGGAILVAALFAASAALADGVIAPGIPDLRTASGLHVAYAPGPGGYGPASMISPILYYTNSVPSPSVTNYAAFLAGNFNPTNIFRRMPSPIPGRIANLEVLLPTAVIAGYYTVSLNVNGVSTALQCSIGQGGINLGTTTACSDTADQVQINAGDMLGWQSTPSGTPTTLSGATAIAATLQSANDQETLVGDAPNNVMSTSAIQYEGLSQQISGLTTDALASSVMPTAGIFDRLYIDLSAAEPSGDGVQFTIFKNGVATSLQVNCLQAVLCADSTDVVSVAAGDTISLQICPYGVAGCPAGVALANDVMNFSLRFKPSTANQALLFSVPSSLPIAATTSKFMPIAANNTWFSSDPNSQNIAPALTTTMTLGNLTVAQCPGPDSTGASGVTRTFTARMGGVNQSSTVAIVGNSTAACPTVATGRDTTHTFQATSAALLNLATVLNTTTNAAVLTELKYSMTATVP